MRAQRGDRSDSELRICSCERRTKQGVDVETRCRDLRAIARLLRAALCSGPSALNVRPLHLALLMPSNGIVRGVVLRPVFTAPERFALALFSPYNPMLQLSSSSDARRQASPSNAFHGTGPKGIAVAAVILAGPECARLLLGSCGVPSSFGCTASEAGNRVICHSS
jgi:hypothetical protein